jgi:hypothetical protein
MNEVHAQARTTAHTRAEIKESPASLVALAETNNINPDVSRSGLDRCLRCHGVGNLRDLQAQALVDAKEVQAPVKTFKDYEPGFLHMDIKCRPQILCLPRYPRTNGSMVGRFNGKISEVVKQTRFALAAVLEATLESHVKTYNHQIAQRALKHLSPAQALKIWQKKTSRVVQEARL